MSAFWRVAGLRLAWELNFLQCNFLHSIACSIIAISSDILFEIIWQELCDNITQTSSNFWLVTIIIITSIVITIVTTQSSPAMSTTRPSLPPSRAQLWSQLSKSPQQRGRLPASSSKGWRQKNHQYCHQQYHILSSGPHFKLIAFHLCFGSLIPLT